MGGTGAASCTVAIEGCMDSTMVNYDPNANINSKTWCIPVVRGCMLPSTEMSTSFPQSVRDGSYDGLASNFDYAATVDEGCKVERVGCMDSSALNYDAAATVQGTTVKGTMCWYDIEACMNPEAVNFG